MPKRKFDEIVMDKTRSESNSEIDSDGLNNNTDTLELEEEIQISSNNKKMATNKKKLNRDSEDDDVYEPRKQFKKKVLDPYRKKKGVEIVKKLVHLSKIYAQHCEDKKNSKKMSINLDNMKYFTGGKLKPYQVTGVNWLLNIMRIGINGILADEMGLGKTIQIIALLSHLFEKKLKGPHLIAVPFSTLHNWMEEFKRFAPELPVVYLPGTKNEKIEALPKITQLYTVGDMKTYPIVIVGHKTIPREPLLLTIHWKYIIIDEAQMMKNHESLLGQSLRSMKCQNKILLTGTPLQNNMKELWSLLNFIMPNIFSTISVCQSFLLLEDMEENKIVEDADDNKAIVSKIQEALAPFMLRRLKTEVLTDLAPKKEVTVYCSLTDMQGELYTFVLKESQRLLNYDSHENIETPKTKRKCRTKFNFENDMNVGNLFTSSTPRKSEKELEMEQMIEVIRKKKMTNPTMALHLIVNHPYIIHEPLSIMNDELINSSGKMLVLDKLLKKLKERGHRVLIFSTFKTVVYLLETYADYRKYKYKAITGDTSLEERKENIDDYNSDTSIFLFFMTTRAGGLGINLTTADTVIIFDQDWNPQSDLQAMDRCHRIGQLKPVMVYTLVAKNTIDEKILDYATKKKRLGNIILKNDAAKVSFRAAFNITEFLDYLNENVSKHKIYTNGIVPSDEEIDILVDRSDLVVPSQM